MKDFVKLDKAKPGDKVAILSPSSGLAGLFPWVQDLGLERIRGVFNLTPVEYPTTRKMHASLEDRAKDIMDAFSDPEIKAIITSIGGYDEIRLLKYLDPSVFLNHPKPFFGYSDNTHLCAFLWNLGVPSYYGGAVMTQFAMQHEMHPTTIESLKAALFQESVYELLPSELYNDEGLSWGDKDNLSKSRKWEKNDGHFWNGSGKVSGKLWGGCVESLLAQFTVGRYLPRESDLDGTVLFIETSEDLPDPWIVEYLLTGLGERGWFDRFSAILVGRPKAWEFNKQNDSERKASYRKEQREVVLDTVRLYNKNILLIQNLDFGHTDPQIILPYGGSVSIDSDKQRISLQY